MDSNNTAEAFARRHAIAKLIAVYTAAKNQNVPQQARRIARIRFGMEDFSEADFQLACEELAHEALKSARALGLTINPSRQA